MKYIENLSGLTITDTPSLDQLVIQDDYLKFSSAIKKSEVIFIADGITVVFKFHGNYCSVNKPIFHPKTEKELDEFILKNL